MKRIAFRMQLNQGQATEYKKRHDEIWPELVQLLKSAGIAEYSIFLDEDKHDLFAIMHIQDQSEVDQLASAAVMRKWWSYMKDIMVSNPDDSPVTSGLTEVFYLQ